MTDLGGPAVEPPIAGEPAWLPDPTRRHQLRWFDGTSFTDQVADGTFRSTDPGGPESPPAAPGAHGQGAAATTAGRLPLVLVLVGIGVGAVLGGGAYLLFGGDDDGFGSFDGEVADDPAGHDISLSGGSAAIVRLRPSSDFDAVVSFALGGDDADQIEALYEGTVFEDDAVAVDGELFRVDIGFEGDDELAFLAVPFGVDATVVVSGFDGSAGEYEIDIERIALAGLEEDSDGGEVLDAVVASDDVPIALRQAIESRLEE